MEWSEFLVLLNIVTTRFCEKEVPNNVKCCIENVRECVLDGETFKFCAKTYIKEYKNLSCD